MAAVNKGHLGWLSCICLIRDTVSTTTLGMLPDAKIQVISGHQNPQNLAIYQDLSLATVAKEYQEAMRDFPVK